MSIRRKLIEAKDLFMVDNFKPLADKSKMRRFDMSKPVALGVVCLVVGVPFWLSRNYFSQTITIDYNA